ncbi:MAG: hypothetical protein ACRDZQ_07595 [Acidimicrobiales bacterium]
MVVAATTVAIVALFTVAALGVVLAGLTRHVELLEQRLAMMSSAIPTRIGRLGLRVGSPAPSFDGPRLDGTRFASSQLVGVPHLVLLAHPGCEPRETQVSRYREGGSYGAGGGLAMLGLSKFAHLVKARPPPSRA